MNFSTKLLFSAAALALGASAIGQTGAFPEGAEPLTQESLHEALSGKAFTMNSAKGSEWRWQFDANGYFFFNAGGGYTNSGKWSTKGSSVCQDTGKTPGCNEMRQKNNVLYLVRDNGELLTFKPQ